jgi:hypothetical protein
VENAIRELKYGFDLNHMPSGQFGANAAWLALNPIAYNLGRWLGRLTDQIRRQIKATRYRLFGLPGRLARSGRRLRLRLPRDWPWASEFTAALVRLRALPPSIPV